MQSDSNLIDLASERLKRAVDVELQKWCIYIENMPFDELEAILSNLEANRIDGYGIKPEDL